MLDGLIDDVSVTAEPALLTVCVNTADVLDPKFPSPLYKAVIEWDPTAIADVVKVA